MKFWLVFLNNFALCFVIGRCKLYNHIRKKIKTRKSIEEWVASRPNAKLCLHNGFAGFSFGCPSNPIFLDKDYAIMIIEKVIEIEHKSLNELLYLHTTINIENVLSEFPELEKIGYRYIGLNIEAECLYGETGLG